MGSLPLTFTEIMNKKIQAMYDGKGSYAPTPQNPPPPPLPRRIPPRDAGYMITKERDKKMQDLKDVIYQMAANMKIMNKNMESMDERITDLESRLNRYDDKTSERPKTVADLAANKGL